MIRERAPQLVGIAREDASGLERRVEPLVRIDGDRVSEPQCLQIAWGSRNCGGERTVGSIDVEPGAKLAADLNDIEERIDDARAHRSRCPNHHQRPLSCAAILRECRPKRASVDAQVRIR